MTAALNGNLRDFGISEVFQLIGQQQKTGLLVVEGSETLHVAFDGGAVVWAAPKGPYEEAALGERLVRASLLPPERLALLEAELTGSDRRLSEVLADSGDISVDAVQGVGDLITSDTIFELLRWSSGSFRFTSQPVSHSKARAELLPAEQILMDGLRTVDEWGSLDAAATRPDSVFERVGSFDLFLEAHPGERPERLAVAERLFLLIDGRLTTRRVIDLSRLGLFEAARLLSRLRSLGVIEPLDAEQLARTRRPMPGALKGRGLPSMGTLLGLVPFATLAVVVVLAGRPVEPPAQVLGRDVQVEADAAYETLRARQLALAYRYARGVWPQGTADLEEWSGVPLAAPEGGSYYFRRTEHGVVVLSPDPGSSPGSGAGTIASRSAAPPTASARRSP